jgi:hypothetical protein
MPAENRKGETRSRRRNCLQETPPQARSINPGHRTSYQKEEPTSLRVIKDNIDNLCAVMVGTARVEPSDN